MLPSARLFSGLGFFLLSPRHFPFFLFLAAGYFILPFFPDQGGRGCNSTKPFLQTAVMVLPKKKDIAPRSSCGIIALTYLWFLLLLKGTLVPSKSRLLAYIPKQPVLVRAIVTSDCLANFLAIAIGKGNRHFLSTTVSYLS